MNIASVVQCELLVLAGMVMSEGGYVPHFTLGERVAVTSGPFSGLEAIFQRYIPARQRCQVLLQILGRLAKVEVPAEVLGGKIPYRGLAFAT